MNTPFQLTKISDVGTGNPIVARLSIGLLEVLKFTYLQADQIEAVFSSCNEIKRALVQAEKAANPLLDEIRQIQEELRLNGAKTQSGGRVIETPGVMHLDNVRTFVKYGKQGLMHVSRAVGRLLDIKIDSPRFDLMIREYDSRFGSDHPLTKKLREDHDEWLKGFIDLRNEEEHPSSDQPFVSGFSITSKPDGAFEIRPPVLINGVPVVSYLETMSYNLLTFSEELIARTAETFFPPIVGLDEIPAQQRSKKCPVRYRPALRSGFE